MKKYFIAYILLLLTTTSCNQKEEVSSETSTDTELNTIDSSSYRVVDLQNFGIERKILVPKNRAGREEIIQSSNGSIEVNIDKDLAVEIIPNPASIEEKKAELESDPVFQINYIEETQDYIFYARDIEGSGIDSEYHFYMIMGNGNEMIAVKSPDMSQLKKEEAEAILNTFKLQLKKTT